MGDVTREDVGSTEDVEPASRTPSDGAALVVDEPAFDVFLSYSRDDERAVHRIARVLREEGLRPWLDVWQTTGGRPWQDELAEGLQRSRCCAVFIGPGSGGADGSSTPSVAHWAREELMVAVNRAATDPTFRVFLVLLEGVPEPFDAGALHPFLAMRTWVDLRRGSAHPRSVQQLLNAVRGIPFDAPGTVQQRDDEPPYKGLAVFEESDARFFFGRDAERQRILEKLRTSPFVAVFGPSGSGKSSLVRAGVLPQVRAGEVAGGDEWTIITLTPGSRPLDTLAGHLARLDSGLALGAIRDQLGSDDRTLRLLASGRPRGSRLLLVVDQFEEIFTLCSNEEERRRLIGNLLEATSGDASCTVVLTMRADFYPHCAAIPELAQRVSTHQFLVGPMDRESLRQVIEAPAHLVGLSFEPGLVDVILDDVGGEAGSLPLLEHALLELWERRLGDLLTLEGYHESGGVAGALAQRADATWAALDPDEQRAARRVLLRLTRPGEGSEDTRQRAYLEELSPNPQEQQTVDEVVRELADARLLAVNVDLRTERVLVDVTHEALIRAWPRLREWIDENREGLQILKRLTEGAREWDELGRDPGALLRGARLAMAREWAATAHDQLNELERDFLEASAAAEHQELEEERRRAEQERLRAEKEARSARRLRVLAAGLAVLLLAAVAATAIAAVQTRRANEESRRATALARRSTAEAAAERAVNMVGRSPQQALLLGLEALEMEPTAAPVRSGMLQTAVGTWRIGVFLEGHDGSVPTAEPSPVEHAWVDDRLVPQPGGPVRLVASAGHDGTVRMWDAAAGEAVGEPLTGHEGQVTTVAVSPDGRTIASAGQDGRILLWDVATGRRIGGLEGHGGEVLTVRFRPPDGRVLASASVDGTVRLWDLADRTQLAALPANGGEPAGDQPDASVDDVSHVAFRPDGDVFATAGRDGTIQLWASDGARLSPPLPADDQAVADLEFAGDGSVLVSGGRSGAVRFWDVVEVDDGQLGLSERATRSEHPYAVFAVATSGDGRLAATAGIDGGVIVWDVASATPSGEVLRAHPRNVLSLAFDPEQRLLSAGVDGAIVSWDVGSAVPAPFGRQLDGHRIVAGADALVTADADGRVVWHDPGSLEEVADTGPAPRRITALAARPATRATAQLTEGSAVVASGSDDGTVRTWDAARRPVGAPFDRGSTISALAFSPVAPLLVAGEEATGLLSVLDLERREVVTTLPASPRVRDVAISPDGRLAAAAGGDDRVRLFDLAELEAVGVVPSDEVARRRGVGHTAWTSAVAFSPDGTLLATGSLDGTVALWDVETREPAGRPLEAQAGQVTSVAFSPDGDVLAAATDTGAVELWEVGEPRTAQLLGVLPDPHSTWTWSVDFTADGRLVTAADDQTAVVWSDLVPGAGVEQWQGHVCGVVAATLSTDEWALHLGDEPYDPSCAGDT